MSSPGAPKGFAEGAQAQSRLPRRSAEEAEAQSRLPRGSAEEAEAQNQLPRGSAEEAEAQSRLPRGSAEETEAQIRLPRGFVVALADAQVDVEALARSSGLASQLATPEPILSATQLSRLYDALFAPSVAADLGLRIGARVKAELFGVVGLAALSAATYGAAVERCARYKRMLTDMHLELTSREDAAVVRIEVPGPPAPPTFGRVDIELAFLASFGRSVTERPIALQRVRLRRPPPGDDAHAAFFGCPVSFSADDDELHLAPASLSIPLLGADVEAHRALIDLAERQLDDHNEPVEPVVARARMVIERLLSEGPPRLSAVARQLATSERSLQRALKRHGTSYAELLDSTRRQLAFALLRQGRCKIVEVAYLVGFSHLSSFYRAFERWAGTSPAAFVAEVRADAGMPTGGPASPP